MSGRALILPVTGRALILPVAGRVLILPVAGRALILPVDIDLLQAMVSGLVLDLPGNLHIIDAPVR